MTGRWLAASFALLACGDPPPTDPAPTDPLAEPLRAQMVAGGLPGLSVLVAKGGVVLHQAGYGHADLERRIAADPHTLFIVASLSKTFVATAILQLVEDGVLALDDDVGVVLGAPIRHPDHPDTPITIRMLLSHVSGIVDDFLKLGSVTIEGDPPDSALRAFALDYATPAGALYAASNFGARPGARRSYCNACFGILGAVVEARSGESFRSFTRRRIFEPLGMSESGWYAADVPAQHLAVPYVGTFESGFEALPQQGFAFYPATSLRTNLVDLHRFLDAFRRGGAGLLAAASVEAMRTPSYPEVDDTQGLAWSYDTYGGERYFSHTGATTGGSALMLLRERDGAALLIITNSDAYIRSRLGFPEGRAALHAIVGILADYADTSP